MKLETNINRPEGSRYGPSVPASPPLVLSWSHARDVLRKTHLPLPIVASWKSSWKNAAVLPLPRSNILFSFYSGSRLGEKGGGGINMSLPFASNQAFFPHCFSMCVKVRGRNKLTDSWKIYVASFPSCLFFNSQNHSSFCPTLLWRTPVSSVYSLMN